MNFSSFLLWASVISYTVAIVEIVRTPFVTVKFGAFTEVENEQSDSFVKCMESSQDFAHLITYDSATGHCGIGTYDPDYIPSPGEQDLSVTFGKCQIFITSFGTTKS